MRVVSCYANPSLYCIEHGCCTLCDSINSTPELDQGVSLDKQIRDKDSLLFSFFFYFVENGYEKLCLFSQKNNINKYIKGRHFFKQELQKYFLGARDDRQFCNDAKTLTKSREITKQS